MFSLNFMFVFFRFVIFSIVQPFVYLTPLASSVLCSLILFCSLTIQPLLMNPKKWKVILHSVSWWCYRTLIGFALFAANQLTLNSHNFFGQIDMLWCCPPESLTTTVSIATVILCYSEIIECNAVIHKSVNSFQHSDQIRSRALLYINTLIVQSYCDFLPSVAPYYMNVDESSIFSHLLLL